MVVRGEVEVSKNIERPGPVLTRKHNSVNNLHKASPVIRGEEPFLRLGYGKSFGEESGFNLLSSKWGSPYNMRVASCDSCLMKISKTVIERNIN